MRIFRSLAAGAALLLASVGIAPASASSILACNSNTYTWPDQFQGYGYVTYWPLMLNDCLTQIAGSVTSAQQQVTLATQQVSLAQAAAVTATMSSATQSTSSTSLAIGTGSKSLTVQTGEGYLPGMTVRIADTTAPTANYMDGLVSSYTSSTGALVVTVTGAAGSGTKTSWNVFMEGPITPLTSITNSHLLANTSGTTAAPVDTSVSALLDAAIGNAVGGVVTRGASAWGESSAGAAGQVMGFSGSPAVPTPVNSPILYTLSQTVISTAVTTIDFTGLNATDAKIDISGIQVSGTSVTLSLYYSTNNGVSWTFAGVISAAANSAQPLYGFIWISGVRSGHAVLFGLPISTATPPYIEGTASVGFLGQIEAGAQINGFRLAASTGNFPTGTVILETR